MDPIIANVYSVYEEDFFQKYERKHDCTDQHSYESGIIIVDDDSSSTLSVESHPESMKFNISRANRVNKHKSTVQNSIQSLQINDDNSESEELSINQCAVCDVEATGIHYGRPTCEACKDFFKRTVQNKQKYQCNNNGTCVINKSKRKSCRACRFDKCLAKGMITEFVRHDRKRGSLKSEHNTKPKPKPVQNITSDTVINILTIKTPTRPAKSIRKSIDSINELDNLSKLDLLFNHLQPLLDSKIYITKDLIKKICLSLINIFMDWYHTLPFYSIVHINFNKIILNNQWSTYILLTICYFLKLEYKETNVFTYENCLKRIRFYTGDDFLPSLSNGIFNQFLQFLSKFFYISLTKTEFNLLSVIIILQTNESNEINIKFLRETYSKILHTYETNIYLSEERKRHSQLFDLCKEIHSITKLLLTHQYFYLPFLLLPNK